MFWTAARRPFRCSRFIGSVLHCSRPPFHRRIRGLCLCLRIRSLLCFPRRRRAGALVPPSGLAPQRTTGLTLPNRRQCNRRHPTPRFSNRHRLGRGLPSWASLPPPLRLAMALVVHRILSPVCSRAIRSVKARPDRPTGMATAIFRTTVRSRLHRGLPFPPAERPPRPVRPPRSGTHRNPIRSRVPSSRCCRARRPSHRLWNRPALFSLPPQRRRTPHRF